MIKDRTVRVKLKKHYKEQRPISYVGKVVAFSDYWMAMEALTLQLNRHEQNGVQIDKVRSQVLIPRDNIESIRVLPDTFDIKKLQVTTEGQQLQLIVEGGAPCHIGDLGEG